LPQSIEQDAIRLGERMQDNAYDHLIIGSTPLAFLVAGLLGREHGRRVCLVAEPYSSFGLERRFDCSIEPVTRPQTLILLKRLAAETLKLVNGMGKALVDRVDPLLVAESRAGMAALGHFHHIAQLLGIEVERIADRTISEGTLLRVRGQHLIAHHRFAPALEGWLDGARVLRLDPDDTSITIRKDGTARIAAASLEAEAAAVVLADDAAVLAYLSPETWDRAIVRTTSTALLLQPARPAPVPLSLWLDRGLVLRQEPKGPLAATLGGDRHTAEARVAGACPRSLPLRRAGEARSDALATSDGAPLLAPARGVKVTHLAGFGLSGAFLAPAIARQLAGVAPEDEAAWFAAHGATRGNLRLNAAEYGAVTPA
jgi:hypothetical protein